MKRILTLTLLMAFLAAGQLLGANIFLKNGQVLPGEIVEIDEEKVVLAPHKANYYGRVYLRRDDILRIFPPQTLSQSRYSPDREPASDKLLAPEVDFDQLDRVFEENYTSLGVEKKSKEEVIAQSFPPPANLRNFPAFSLHLSQSWKRVEKSGSKLIKFQSSRGKISLFEIDSPSGKMEDLVKAALNEHYQLNPGFELLKREILPQKQEAYLMGQGAGKKIVQKFFIRQGKLFVFTGFSYGEEGLQDIQGALLSWYFKKNH